MLSTLNDDIIRLLFTYCDNKSSYNLIQVSKIMYEVVQKKGFAKCISFDYSREFDFELFMNRFKDHYYSLKTCVMSNCTNPQYWMMKWPQHVYFFYCDFLCVIRPITPVETKVLYITHKKCINVNIDWEKFPLLEKITIKKVIVNNIGDIDKCKYLKELSYDVSEDCTCYLKQLVKKVKNVKITIY